MKKTRSISNSGCLVLLTLGVAGPVFLLKCGIESSAKKDREEAEAYLDNYLLDKWSNVEYRLKEKGMPESSAEKLTEEMRAAFNADGADIMRAVRDANR